MRARPGKYLGEKLALSRRGGPRPANKRPPWVLLKTQQKMLKTSNSMLKTLHLARSRATFARFHQSVDCSTCCCKPSAFPRRTAASTARAIAHHC